MLTTVSVRSFSSKPLLGKLLVKQLLVKQQLSVRSPLLSSKLTSKITDNEKNYEDEEIRAAVNSVEIDDRSLESVVDK